MVTVPHRITWVSVPLIALLVACASPPPTGRANVPVAAADAHVRLVLAPTGRLRVAVYRGSPSSIIEAAGVEPKGVAYDLGRELARRLDVVFEPVVFSKNEDALAAMRAGTADLAFTNATPARAAFMDFSPSVMDVGKSFLVPARSEVMTIADMKRPGARIGVSEGSSTEAELRPDYPEALLIRVPTLKAAGDMLLNGRLDAFATNNAILYQLSDTVKGSKVLPGLWGMEHFALGIPKGRDEGRAFLADFARSMQEDGFVARAAQRAGLRGTVEPDPLRLSPR